MMRSLVLAGLVMGMGLAGAADDPPKELTPGERQELEAKAKERIADGAKAYRAQRGLANRCLHGVVVLVPRLYSPHRQLGELLAVGPVDGELGLLEGEHGR